MLERLSMSKAIIATVFTLLVGFVDHGLNARTAGERFLVTISSGQVGGVYYPAAGIICRLLHLERARHGIRCVVDSTRGSLENLGSLAQGRADLGIVQTDIQFAAVNGPDLDANGAEQATRLRALFSLHAEPITIVTRLAAGVNEFRDLVGKRVNVGELGSGSFATANVLMQAHGMSSTDLRRQFNLSASEAATALCENRIDAMILVVGHPNATVRRVSETCAVRFVSVTGQVADDLLAQKPYFSKSVIAAGTYVGQDTDISSLGVRASVLTTASLPDMLAYEITRAVIVNNAQLRGLHPAFATLEPAQMLQGNTAPWHPGALKFLDEQNLLPASKN